MTEFAEMSREQIKAEVFARLDQYKDRSALEQYAIFMGKAQILEFGLKGLLARKFNVSHEEMERWTLGKTKNELRDRGVRPDFIRFLESVVDHRNNMAHEFLVNTEITRSLANFSDRKVYGDLFRALYELEQIIILHDWCEINNGWLPRG
ncbi:hypothetical protein OII53_03575 [Achromobacter ruhlandii]|uniref:hypothetical protein n=1 Tax=Achromobacter ruhlandii TaxID=72557 RepID=UPI0021F12718|nr:hypothetical protein [Achromobacter ruhlandii]MCV6795660.1 hypothetical protein [Achromobacter ruhlandii]MCV6800608.1 hypothetical protein [Achromobacter ruhlandii]MCV6807300.1 hypothetical protein [Achromobacter ruhlandii]MCV6817595.1 hypothetical protein [Achromobacter ruhlandii]